MKIKSVAVLGAGAVGSYVIWGLSEKSDIRLGVIAEGERAERLKKNGCAINGKTYHPEVWTPDEAHDVDLMVVALKYGSLEGALESIQKATGEHTAIMSLMNGIDSEEIIGRTVGMEHVLPALIKVASHKSDGLKRELEAVAQAKGIDMSKTESSSGRGSAVPPSARYSTLQDLDAGCHTEIDMFSGALVRMGKELGIPMPYNEYTYHMIKALEEKNDGKFDYTGKEELTWSK